MKKFISMVMAAAMVVSVVPATAFAADAKATVKVVDSKNLTEAEAEVAEKGYKGAKPAETPTAGIKDAGAAPEVQIKVTAADFTAAELLDGVETEVTLSLDNAEWLNGKNTTLKQFQDMVTVADDDATNVETNTKATAAKDLKTTGVAAPKVTEIKDVDDDQVTLVFGGAKTAFEKDDKISIDLSSVVLTKTSAGAKATVAVDSDDLDVATEDLTFVEVKDAGIKATVKKVAEVAEEETTTLEKNLKIESEVGNFVDGQTFELKLSGSFEFTKNLVDKEAKDGNYGYSFSDRDENKVIVTFHKGSKAVDNFEIDKDAIEIDAASAKEGAVAKLTVKALKNVAGQMKATADAIEVVKVVGETVTLSVDEDEDVPVIYSGVDVDNNGITDDSDHEALEVTLKESTKSALDVKKSFTMDLPEGVYVTDVAVKTKDNVQAEGGIDTAFAKAYKKGEYDGFEFARRTFTDTDKLSDAMELSFVLTLVAEPDFEGDVTLTLGGDAFDKEQEVVIAKFVKPYTVEASQNDLIIDYRNTKVPTNIVVKEAEEGLWKKGLEFTFGIDKFDDDDFENDATYTVDDKSDLEIKEAKNGLGFKVDDESSDEPAAVTISDISLYMQRNIAAGAYDLQLITNANINMYAEELAVESTVTTDIDNVKGYFGTTEPEPAKYTVADDKDFVDKNDSLNIDSVDKATVKEGFINVITAGRDQDDASFTKKVVVPVGENYLIAGEEQVALDVPAYISADGYTMLPVRAVATALGINNNNVLWNQASKTVTILYGQRIITMVAGQKVVTVNGNTIPASATVQIVNGRTFLPMRDLATALGVTDITWDAATKTATMNGNK